MLKAVIIYVMISPLSGDPETFYFNGRGFEDYSTCENFYRIYESNIKNGILEFATKTFNTDAAVIHEIGCITQNINQFYEETLTNKKPLYKK